VRRYTNGEGIFEIRAVIFLPSDWTIMVWKLPGAVNEPTRVIQKIENPGKTQGFEQISRNLAVLQLKFIHELRVTL
jgi:hypothetical protein